MKPDIGKISRRYDGAIHRWHIVDTKSSIVFTQNFKDTIFQSGFVPEFQDIPFP